MLWSVFTFAFMPLITHVKYCQTDYSLTVSDLLDDYVIQETFPTIVLCFTCNKYQEEFQNQCILPSFDLLQNTAKWCMQMLCAAVGHVVFELHKKPVK